jgi:hypothetical protein
MVKVLKHTGICINEFRCLKMTRNVANERHPQLQPPMPSASWWE